MFLTENDKIIQRFYALEKGKLFDGAFEYEALAVKLFGSSAVRLMRLDSNEVRRTLKPQKSGSICVSYERVEFGFRELTKSEREQYALYTGKRVQDMIADYEERLQNERGIKSISYDRFCEMMEVLPPLRQLYVSGFTVFALSEMYTGTLTMWFAWNDERQTGVEFLADKGATEEQLQARLKSVTE